MRRGVLEVVGGAVAFVAVLAGLWVSRDGTDPAQLMTAWGEPDLQGLWANTYRIPLQRSPEFGDQEFLTDEQLGEREEHAEFQPTFSDRTAERGTEQDVAGAYDVGFQPERRPTGRRTSLVVNPSNGRIPPLTAAVEERNRDLREYRFALMQAVETCRSTRERACTGVTYGPPSPRRASPPPHYLPNRLDGEHPMNRADGPEDFGLTERCLSGQPPNLGNVQRIVQSAGTVSILYEGWHRVIPVTTRAHLPSHVRQWRGDARAHWEGLTLVVDVTNFTPKTAFHGSRQNLHVVERFTRIDINTLEYVATIDDSTTWVAPWTFTVDLTRQDDQANQIYDEPRCHDGNYGMTAMLMGARTDDKAFAEGRGPDPATKCYVICGFGNPELAEPGMNR